MYKIKTFLPLKVRLQVYHSFLKSHINYCSLVWGFTSKSNIEKLFSAQKKAMRAVIPGFINYRYRAGNIPGHTKAAFSEYKILTIHNLIALNSLFFIYKIKNFPMLVPVSISSTIADDSPTAGSTLDTCENWYNMYNNHIYRKSIFCKGPLISATSTINLNISTIKPPTLKAYRAYVKNELLNAQSIGDTEEWQNDNFIIYNVNGLRESLPRMAKQSK